MSYEIKWITSNLGVGRAPMSYEDLDAIRAQGINAIVNLCHEYSDLHELEEQAGFEVYYLPTYDEYAPDSDELEKGLQWLDEALYLKKRVLVHCRFGQGRTGTFTSAYLLRRGLGMKRTQKTLQKTRAIPSTNRQWRALKKFGKLQGELTISPPRAEHGGSDDLPPFYNEYRSVVESLDRLQASGDVAQICGKNNDCCCQTSFYIPLLEALYINDCLNRLLTASARNEAIERALACRVLLQNSLGCLNRREIPGMQELYIKDSFLCPLSVNGSCILFDVRPIRCRTNGGEAIEPEILKPIIGKVELLSNEVFYTLAGRYPEGSSIHTSIVDIISGKFFQTYFHLMAAIQ